jgi:hypothetical protein
MNLLSFEVKGMYSYFMHKINIIMCPQSFQLQNDANFIAGLRLEVQVKKNILVELCVGIMQHMMVL